jgi:hypothetical protein
MDFYVPDPIWKTNPDVVAGESADERYIWDDYEEDDENAQ